MNDPYGAWTDPPFVPDHHLKQKKSVAMRWLDPEWSLVGWVKGMFTEESDEPHPHQDPHYH